MFSSSSTTMPEISPIWIIVWLAVVVFILACYWRIFTKAGRPGFYSLIPILNVITMFDIAGLSCFFIIGLFIPVVNFFVIIYFYVKFAEAYGQGFLFALGLIFLPFIFVPIMAFSGIEYVGAGGEKSKIKRDFA
jgi:hypothetical protein